MSAYRITKVVCPSCKGSGRNNLFDVQCLWCCGDKRLHLDDLEDWSQQMMTIAVGGYIAGDHDLDDCQRLKTEVNAVRRLAMLPELRT